MPHYHPNLTPSEDTDELLACLRLQKRLIACPVCGGAGCSSCSDAGTRAAWAAELKNLGQQRSSYSRGGFGY